MAVRFMPAPTPVARQPAPDANSKLAQLYAQLLLKNATSTGPIKSHWEGANKLAQGALAGLELNRLDAQSRASAAAMGELAFGPGAAGSAKPESGLLGGLGQGLSKLFGGGEPAKAPATDADGPPIFSGDPTMAPSWREDAAVRPDNAALAKALMSGKASDAPPVPPGDIPLPRGDTMAAISMVGETGRPDFSKQAQIARDTGGSKSYGVFGLNSWGKDVNATSIGQFAKTYGPQLGLTATPATPEFDAQWRAAAANAPDALKDAQLAWHKSEIGDRVQGALTGIGIPEPVAKDTRVQGYFADRMVQQGPASISRHADRILTAYAGADNDPAAFLTRMSAADRGRLGGDFRSYLSEYPERTGGLANRIGKREALSLALRGVQPASQPNPFDRAPASPSAMTNMLAAQGGVPGMPPAPSTFPMIGEAVSAHAAFPGLSGGAPQRAMAFAGPQAAPQAPFQVGANGGGPGPMRPASAAGAPQPTQAQMFNPQLLPQQGPALGAMPEEMPAGAGRSQRATPEQQRWVSQVGAQLAPENRPALGAMPSSPPPPRQFAQAPQSATPGEPRASAAPPQQPPVQAQLQQEIARLAIMHRSAMERRDYAGAQRISETVIQLRQKMMMMERYETINIDGKPVQRSTTGQEIASPRVGKDFQLKEVNGRLYRFNPAKGTAEDITPSTAGPAGLFTGNAIDAQALNELVRTGKMTREEAAQYAAGKTITGPNNEQLFLTPDGFRSASGAAPRAQQHRGIVPLTAPKPKDAPAGYQWNDPNNPGGGMTAIPGGPATRDASIDHKVRTLVQSGVPEKIAQGIAGGRYTVNRHPISGAAQVVDVANGTVIFDGSQQPQQQPQTSPDGAPPPGPGSSLPPDIDYTRGTGSHGFAASIANTVSDLFQGKLPAPEAERAVQALTNLQVRTQTMLQDAIPGRPSNYLMEQLNRLSVHPGSLTQGPERAYERLRQTRDMIREEVTRMDRDVLSRPQDFKPDQIAKARSNRSQLESVLRDYDVVVGSFERSRGGQQQQSGPPPGAVDALRSNPQLRGQFDEKYGRGASERFLGGR